jgi:WD40 repeat protein
VAISPDGKRLATGGSEDPAVKIFEIPGGRLLAGGSTPGGPTYSITWTGDGRALVTHHEDHSIRALDGQSAVEQVRLATVQYQSHSLAQAPDGKTTAYPLETGAIVLRSGADWKGTMKLEGHPKATFGMAFHPGGRSLASAGPQGLIFWDLVTGKRLAEKAADFGGEVRLTFSADGRRLVVALKDQVVVYGAPR